MRQLRHFITRDKCVQNRTLTPKEAKARLSQLYAEENWEKEKAEVQAEVNYLRKASKK